MSFRSKARPNTAKTSRFGWDINYNMCLQPFGPIGIHGIRVDSEIGQKLLNFVSEERKWELMLKKRALLCCKYFTNDELKRVHQTEFAKETLPKEFEEIDNRISFLDCSPKFTSFRPEDEPNWGKQT